MLQNSFVIKKEFGSKYIGFIFFRHVLTVFEHFHLLKTMHERNLGMQHGMSQLMSHKDKFKNLINVAVNNNVFLA